MKFRTISYLLGIFSLFLVTGCLKNDIPYPIVLAAVTDMEVDDMIGSAKINVNDRTISITVGDSVNVSSLRLTKFVFTEEASLTIPNERMANPSKFPSQPFSSLDKLPMSADTRLDFSNPLQIVLSTYQDYVWTVSVNQQIEREVLVDGQVGNAIVDAEQHKVVIYVDKATPLNKLKVKTFNLGGSHGHVIPNPCDEKYADGYNFSTPQKFYVQHAWEETSTEWQVFVYTSDNDDPTVSGSVFARTVSASFNASGVTGSSVFEYRPKNSSQWLKADAVSQSGSKLNVEMEGLQASTSYNYRLMSGDKLLTEGTFTTTEATPLTDGNLDSWHKTDKLWNPWSNGGNSFWDTGNKGATTIADSNSVPTDDSCDGNGLAACLESKYLVLKFAAGNLFTGTYVRTDGTNGVLDFGRPFSAFPTKLRFRYKYQSKVINRVGDDDLESLRGKPDSCAIYIILADWDKPFTIKTRKSERSLLDPKRDDHIIAYSELSTSESSSSYATVTMPIEYKFTDRRPKYIVVVASASKYGDYFTGGEGSCLWVDNFELLYE